jgi:pilus assembly protein CpaC
MPPELTIRLAQPKTEITVTALQSRAIETEARIRLVDDFDPQIVTVTAVAPNQLRIRGETPGITSVQVTDEFDHVFRVEIMVERDLRELEANLRRLFPGSAVRVIGVKEDIVLQGWVTQPTQIPQIVDLVKTYATNVQNHMQVGGGNQVQLHVKVLEVQRSKLEQLGFNFLTLGRHFYLASTPGALAPIASVELPFGGPPTVTTSANALANTTGQFAIVNSNEIFRGFIEALKQESLLKIIAEPTLITTSGRPAQFHSGGEFPILVPQGVGTASIQFRDFGVNVEAVPITLGNGRVQLDIAAEISERDFSNAVTSGSLVVPGLTSRDVNTRVELNFGETVMLGGLTQDRVVSSTQKVPVLGDVPYLGTLFSRKSHTNSTTEMVILVTPYLSAAMPPGQVPCNGPGQNSGDPTCREFFVDAHMEVPNYAGGQVCPPGMSGLDGYSASGDPANGGYGVSGGYSSAAPYSGESSYAPVMNYAPQPMGAGLQGQPTFPSDQLGPPMSPPGTGTNNLSPTAWPAASRTPSPTAGGYRSAIRPVAGTDADLAPAGATGLSRSPGLIEPKRSAARPAPQYVGSSPITR